MKIDLNKIKEILINSDKNKDYFVNKYNGKIFSLDKKEPSEEERIFWEHFERNRNSYIGLPVEYDHIEYEMMEAFVKSREDGPLKKSLNTIIQRIGAFTRFRQLVVEYGLEQEWLTFQEQEYEKLVEEWYRRSQEEGR